MKKLVILLLLLQGCSVVEILRPCDKDHPVNCEIQDAVEDKIRIEIEDLFKE